MFIGFSSNTNYLVAVVGGGNYATLMNTTGGKLSYTYNGGYGNNCVLTVTNNATDYGYRYLFVGYRN